MLLKTRLLKHLANGLGDVVVHEKEIKHGYLAIVFLKVSKIGEPMWVNGLSSFTIKEACN